MLDFNSILTRIFNQKKEILDNSRLPYYLCLSKDVYESLKDELEKSDFKHKYVKEGQTKVDFFEDLEVVVYGHESVRDYISVIGHAKK